MQLDTDLTGLFGITLAIVTLLVRMPRVKALPLPRRAGLLAAAIVIVSIPLWVEPVVAHLKGPRRFDCHNRGHSMALDIPDST